MDKNTESDNLNCSGVVFRSPSAPCVLDSESNFAAILSYGMFNFAS